MSLLVKGAGDGMSIARVTPESAHWKHVGFAAYRLKAGEAIALAEAAREMCIVVLTGTVDIEAGDGTRWTALGSRDSVFDGVAPYARIRATASVHAPRSGR